MVKAPIPIHGTFEGIVELLDDVRARADDGGTQSVVIVEVPWGDGRMLINRAGPLEYAETIGLLEQAKMALIFESNNIFQDMED